jgi:hypothetical protein
MAFDDSQIDAHGFTTLCRHLLACLPSFSAKLPCHEIVFVHNVIGKGGVEQEWPVFNFERYWKVTTLGNGILKLAVSDETPGAGLWKGQRGMISRTCET